MFLFGLVAADIMIPTTVIIAILALLIGSKKIKGQNDDRVHSKNSDADLARAMPNDSCLPPLMLKLTPHAPQSLEMKKTKGN